MMKKIRLLALLSAVLLFSSKAFAIDSVNHLPYNWDEMVAWQDGSLWFTIDPQYPNAGCALLLPSGVEHSTATAVNIPETSNGKRVIAILQSAFHNNKYVESVSIPSSVQDIVPGAFGGATSLSTIDVDPANFSYVMKSGVLFDASFQELTVWPAALTGVDRYVFRNEEQIRMNLSTIADWACAYAENIPQGCFSGLSNVQSVGDYAFFESSVSDYFYNLRRHIGSHAFDGCKKQTSTSSAAYIGDYAFARSGVRSGYLNVNPDTEYLGKGIYMECPDLMEGSVYQAGGEFELSDSCFYGCPQLSAANINISSVGSLSFGNCTALSNLTLYPEVKEIKSKAFSGCTGLVSITTSCEVPPTLAPDAFDGVSKDCLLSVRTQSGQAAYENTLWDELFTLMPVNVTEGDLTYYLETTRMEAYCIRYSGNDAEITIPASVKVGNVEFTVTQAIGQIDNKSSLRKVNLPSTITVVFGFNDCPELTDINLPEGLLTISSYAFKNCVKLTNPTLPGTLTGIGTNPFNGCTSITEFKITEGDGPYQVQNGCICMGNTILVSVPASRTSVTVPDGVEHIGDYAFGSPLVTTINLPASVFSLRGLSFGDCPALTQVNLAEGAALFAESGCIYSGSRDADSYQLMAVLPSVTDMVVLNGVNYIELTSVLSNPSQLQSIDIPMTVGACYFPSPNIQFASLKAVTCRAEEPPFSPVNYNPAEYSFLSTATLYVPIGTGEAYKNSGQLWSYFSNIEEVDFSGIDEVTISDSDAPVEYYNLQGVRVENPGNGIYIVRQGHKTAKVLVD